MQPSVVGVGDLDVAHSSGAKAVERDRVAKSSSRGSAAVELVLLTPLLVLLLLLVVTSARLVSAELRVDQAASSAARSASLARTGRSAAAIANSAARQAVTGAGVACVRLSVAVDTRAFQPGGTVRVRLTCAVSLRGLTLLALPGGTSVTASAASPIDQWRGAAP